MTCLRLEWASKANCKQRAGRAGRVSNGRVFRLIHKEFYVNYLEDYGAPEMTRCPLSQLVRLQFISSLSVAVTLYLLVYYNSLNYSYITYLRFQIFMELTMFFQKNFYKCF